MGALEGTSDTNLREMRVSTSLPSNFRVQYSFQKLHMGPSRNAMFIVTLDPNKFVEKSQEPLPIGNFRSFTPYVSLRKQSISVLIKDSHIQYDSTRLAHEREFARPSHQTRKPFCITSRRQINPVLRENYASES